LNKDNSWKGGRIGLARKRRVWIPDFFYHIVSRGNRRDALFHDDSDFKIFLHILRQIHKKNPFEIASYCLMTNHYHLLMRSQKQPISKVMALLNKRYADYYNTKNKVTGHVFEKRFYDKIINTNLDMLEVSAYIHLNPLEAGMVKRPELYQWSSYRYYVHVSSHPHLNMAAVFDCLSGSKLEKREAYQRFVKEKKKKSKMTIS